ncbi:MAG: tRNA (adenosine(37)-N6)-dimethylallyltransferase MiaA [Candidatus Saccharimonadales bacterium]|jgi:tRNA dimethylallyltransferase
MPSLIPHPSSPVIVITGPTASGKSALALELAERYQGEIICADSRTVYRGMDIGTAKPSREDQARVPHHLLDVVDPDERFTAADFQVRSRRAIDEIRSRGHLPFVVGGTGLYIDGLVRGYKFGPPADDTLRQQVEDFDVEQLQTMLKKQHISLPHNHDNKRHLIRALEQQGVNRNRDENSCDNYIVVAIATDKQELERRIRERAEEMFAGGIVAEATRLARMYGWDHEALTGNIYPIIRRVVEGDLSIDAAKELFIIKDRQLVKKQLTWLRRRDYVQWLSLTDAKDYLADVLSYRAD